MNDRELRTIKSLAEAWSAEDLLAWASQEFAPDIAMASGFGSEGMVLIDMASRVATNLAVFTIDTDFLFPETYDLIRRVEKRYGIKIEPVRPALTPEQQEVAYGPALWSRSPDQCCALRKVEPLRSKLSGLRAWITAIRRDQTPDRAAAGKVEWDTKFGLYKVNPIADWSSQMVWKYLRENHVPYNPLHDRSYPSIGCTHCTRPVQIGEDPRAGRWSDFDKTECGLHAPEVPR